MVGQRVLDPSIEVRALNTEPCYDKDRGIVKQYNVGLITLSHGCNSRSRYHET